MKIGFIGLGIMGRPMCRNLLGAGFDVMVYARRPEVMDEPVSLGASRAASLAQLAQSCPVIITMLPDSPEVREVLLGPAGVLENAQPGTLVIDMSSIDPAQTRAMGKVLLENGLRLVDAPVSGGEAKAITGELAIMAGGLPADFEECRPILAAMGGSVTYMGALGAGNVTKLANQIIVGLNTAAVAEAMVFARKNGVDPARVYEAIRTGSAGSRALETKLPKMLAHDFTPGFRLELHQKDLTNALAAGTASNVQLPQTTMLLSIMKQLAGEGYALEDHTAILRYFEELSNQRLDE